MSIAGSDFGKLKDGRVASLLVLKNAKGVEAAVSDYGATLVRLVMPDRKGRPADVVLGFDDVTGYQSDQNMYFGCTVGRYANRIAGGQFKLDGQVYSLLVNNGPNHLHGGGADSLDKKLWSMQHISRAGVDAVTFCCTSPHLEEGYPGRLEVEVTYALGDDNVLRIDYRATCDRRTIINLTNHAYWNLAGHGHESILDHEVMILADACTKVDEGLIPTGELSRVENSGLDFRKAQSIRKGMPQVDATATQGFDHNMVLAHAGKMDRVVASLRDPASGRKLEIKTSEPGLQFYSGNFLFGNRGKEGRVYQRRSACCLERKYSMQYYF